MITKAKLQAALADEQLLVANLRYEIRRLNSDLRAAQSEAASYKSAYDGRVALEEKLGVTVYRASASVGQPICVYGNSRADDPVSVHMYVDGGLIIGAILSDGTNGETLAGAGFVPFSEAAH